MASVLCSKNKKARGCRAFGVSRYLGGWLDVRGARALGALLDLVLELVVILQRLETRRLNGGEVHEEILAAVVGRDEAEALLVVEPFNGTCAHLQFP